MSPRKRDPLIKHVFVSEMYILEFFQLNFWGMYNLSPEQLLILLEEKLESGELTPDNIKELLK